MKKFRIVLIDDDQVFLHALSKKLSDAHAVVALASVDEIKSFLEDDARPVDGFFVYLEMPDEAYVFWQLGGSPSFGCCRTTGEGTVLQWCLSSRAGTRMCTPICA